MTLEKAQLELEIERLEKDLLSNKERLKVAALHGYRGQVKACVQEIQVIEAILLILREEVNKL